MGEFQIKHFWEQLAWPDAEGALTFIVKLIDVGFKKITIRLLN